MWVGGFSAELSASANRHLSQNGRTCRSHEAKTIRSLSCLSSSYVQAQRTSHSSIKHAMCRSSCQTQEDSTREFQEARQVKIDVRCEVQGRARAGSPLASAPFCECWLASDPRCTHIQTVTVAHSVVRVAGVTSWYRLPGWPWSRATSSGSDFLSLGPWDRPVRSVSATLQRLQRRFASFCRGRHSAPRGVDYELALGAAVVGTVW